MGGKNNKGRNAIALTLSALLHVVFLAFVIDESATPYSLPETFVPTPEAPVQVEILPPEKLPPTPIIPPKIQKELKAQTAPPSPQPVKPAPPRPSPPTPPKPATPKPTPPTPAPPTPVAPAPARPAPAPRPTPLAPAPSVVRNPAPPSPTPSPTPVPRPARRPSPTPATRIAPPSIVIRPSLLDLHKPAKKAPAGVPTLPMAPAGGHPGGGGGGAPAGAVGGSRLSGLSPYPYGAMPSGGLGLRGTLVGCANATAVHLSSVERARCNQRFGEDVADAPVLDGIDPAKRSAFDKEAARQDMERRHGNAMPVGTDTNGLGMGGLGDPNPR